ncbi:hypothetical protein Tco_1132815 [Tanacetum coccineum]|uniref:Uncharacterized protein n=1 Tax=Tanacetum coccineum TaxID=301880 RepID=A0ABQ5JCZ5_9ASTR
MMFNGEVEKVMQKRRKWDVPLKMVEVVVVEVVVMESQTCEEFGFDSKEDEVVPRVDDVSLVDKVFDGAFGRDGDDDFSIGDGV